MRKRVIPHSGIRFHISRVIYTGQESLVKKFWLRGSFLASDSPCEVSREPINRQATGGQNAAESNKKDLTRAWIGTIKPLAE